MRQTKTVPRVMFTCATVLVMAIASAYAGTDRNPEDDHVWFVHVTDPHFFLDRPGDTDAAKESTREKQEKLNQNALSDLWKQIPSIPHGDHPLAFVVLTGDFGVEPCSIATNPQAKPKAKDCIDNVNKEKRAGQITVLADLLGSSPIRDIYLVAGDKDIPSETAADCGLVYFNHFIDEVQKKIEDAKKNVRLHTLMGCYVSNGAASTCYADIPDTSYRLIGFPSYSFKNRETGYDMNTGPQEKQFETFRSLLDQSRRDGKKILILTHDPLIDDPYALAQYRYAGVNPAPANDKDPKNTRSAWSVWNVSKKLSDEWEEAIASDSVVGILAGHLHDSHKEVYRQPYTWSTVNDHKTGFAKLYMAPPLSVKNQDTSPIQARGFSLVGLESDRIKYHIIYWYNSETSDFTPDRGSEFKWHERHGHWYWRWWRTICNTIAWLWHLADPQKSLDRMAVLLIALLAAFLTVVQIWRIPPAENPLAGPAKSADEKNDVGGAKTTESKPAFDPSPFASNFGKTVIIGLGGLAAETVLKSLENKPVAEDKEFYIVWFIIFFFVLLALTAGLRAMVEAVRTRLAIIHYPLARPTRRVAGKARLFGDWLTYWFLRIVHWFFSLRVPFLTFFDTFINLIQGKNQTMTFAFSEKIIEQQRNVVCVAKAIRRHLNEVILRYLTNLSELKEKEIKPEDVRVNISVLSADQTSVFYIARTPGSAVEAFIKRSVAWVSVFTGKIRWYKHSYKDDKRFPGLFEKIVLFDNERGVILDDEPKIHLSSHYQPRNDDYEAFVIFPVPWPQRGFGSDYVKGAIHISFRFESYFDKIWSFETPEQKDARVKTVRDQAAQEIDAAVEKAATNAEREQLQQGRQSKIDNATAAAEVLTGDPVVVVDNPTYRSEEKMLDDWCRDDEVRATLREAIVVLGELLRGFNENIYKSSKSAADCCES